MKVLRAILGFIRSIPSAIVKILDWLVTVAERLLVLGVALVVFYFGYHLSRGSLTDGQNKALALVGQSWRAVFILMIPLFYQTVRLFLEEVQEIWGMKRPKSSLDKSKILPEISASDETATVTTEEA